MARRAAIAARLREQGRRDEATTISRQPKPKATVWAINRVARTSPKAISRFLAAFDALKRAQLREPAKMDEAATRFREATEGVVHDAIEAMKGSGLATTLDTHRRLANTLRGAASSARGPLSEGRLTDELRPAGFELFAGSTSQGRRAVRAVPAVDERAARDDLARRRASELEAEAESQAREAQRALAAASEARAHLDELEQAARAATRAAAKSRRLAERARKRAGRPGGRRAR